MKRSLWGLEIIFATCLGFLCGSVSAKPWWQNPALKYDEQLVGISGAVDPHYMNKDESDQYLAFVTGSGGGTIYLYSIPSLISGTSSNDVAPIAQGDTSAYWGTAWKGVAVSDDLGRVFTGQTGGGPDHTSFPVTGSWVKDVNTFNVTNDPTYVYFDGCDFGHSSEYLYSDVYNSGNTGVIPKRTTIVKWSVTNLTNNGIGLVTNTVVTTSLSRIRNVSSYYIGGKDLVYYGEGNDTLAVSVGRKVCVYDFDLGAETELLTLFRTNETGLVGENVDVMNVKIGGVGLGQMHLYVQCNDGAVFIYNLNADGKAVGALVKSISSTQMKTLVGDPNLPRIRNFEITDDEQYAFVLNKPSTSDDQTKLHVLWTPPVQKQLWWQNPALKYNEQLLNIYGAVDPHYMNKDESDQYLAFATGSGGGTVYLYSIPELIAGTSSNNVAPIAQGDMTNFWSTAWKGIALSDDLGRIFTGQTGTKPDHTSFSVTGPWVKNVNTFNVTNDPTNVYFDGCDFSHTSEYLYSDVYASGDAAIPAKTSIVKWSVTNLLENGIGVVSNTVAATSLLRVRNVSSYYIGGKDLVYYGEGDAAAATSSKVCVYDFDTGTETTLIDDLPVGSANYDVMNVKIGGVAAGQMHLYVQCNAGAIYIYSLAADGKSVNGMVKSFTADEVKTFVGEAFSKFRNMEVTDDETYAFFLHPPTATAVNLHVVWTPPVQEKLWWQKPAIKFSKDTGVSANLDPHYMNKDESDHYLFVPLASANVNTPGQLYSIPELIAATKAGDAEPIASGTPASLYGNWKGGAVSDDLLRIVTGSGVADAVTHFASLPLTAPWTQGTTVYDLTNNPSAWAMDGIDFSHTSEFLFSDVYNGGYRNLIVKWNVINLNEAGLAFTTNTLFTTSISRIRNVSDAYIGGKDLIYYGEGDDVLGVTERKVCVYDPDLGTETELVTLDRTSEEGVLAADLDVMNVKVGGIGLGGQMHLYVQCNDGALYIYNLHADGKSLDGLARQFTVAEMKTLLVGNPTGTLGSSDRIRCLEFTNDEKYAFFIHKPNTGNAMLRVAWTPGAGTVFIAQ